MTQKKMRLLTKEREMIAEKIKSFLEPKHYIVPSVVLPGMFTVRINDVNVIVKVFTSMEVIPPNYKTTSPLLFGKTFRTHLSVTTFDEFLKYYYSIIN